MSDVRTSCTQVWQAPPWTSAGMAISQCPSAMQGPPVTDRMAELTASTYAIVRNCGAGEQGTKGYFWGFQPSDLQDSCQGQAVPACLPERSRPGAG